MKRRHNCYGTKIRKKVKKKKTTSEQKKKKKGTHESAKGNSC